MDVVIFRQAIGTKNALGALVHRWPVTPEKLSPRFAVNRIIILVERTFVLLLGQTSKVVTDLLVAA